MSWSTNDSTKLYGIQHWGSGFFKINDSGNVTVTPKGPDGPSVDLKALTEELTERGIRAPITIRFQDILKSRVHLLSNCFKKAIDEYGYKGKYRGVYPIKVNQQRFVVKELMGYGKDLELGLEAGSKPELLVVLSQIRNRKAVIVCNGFKDEEYIETAILSLKLGFQVYIVVDRFEELPMIIQSAKKFNTKAKIGFRIKLATKAPGRWAESSGSKSKFGLSPSELMRGIEMLKEADMLDSLNLLHYHIGSQIPSIQYIKGALKEAARFYTELVKLGADMKYIDVGGGLGIDYDGSASTNSSMNYSEQEYANDVVSIIQDICDEKGVQHPNIITEAGRALTAHHSVLVFNVLGQNSFRDGSTPACPQKGDHSLVEDMYNLYEKLSAENLTESYNDVLQMFQDTQQLFTYGVLGLEDRAKAENLYWCIATKMEKIAKDHPDGEDIVTYLKEELSELLFCNFSVFQSLPDAWALGQVFPVMPIQRLNEEPARVAKIGDLTCDSDGKIENFVCTQTWETRSTLPVHDITEDETYYIAVFLTGAYQEILGDLHNLFGDTDSVNISLTPYGYHVDHVVRGDTVAEILSYLEYPKEKIIDSVRRWCEQSIANGELSKHEARLLIRHYEWGLAGYTYLEESEHD